MKKPVQGALFRGPAGDGPANYQNTEHYRITKDFLNRHERMVDILLGAEIEDLKSKERK